MRSVLALGALLCMLAAARAAATTLAEEATSTGQGYRDASGTAEGRTHGDLRIFTRSGVLKPSFGYAPVDVVLHNTGPVPLQVRLSFQGHSVSGTRTSSRTVEVAPRQRLVTWLPVPASLHGGQLTVEAPGLEPLTMSVYLDALSTGTVLVLGTLKDFDDTSGVSRVEPSDNPRFAVRAIDPRDAPRELAAYVGYSVVMVPGDTAAVPADVWAALEAYAASGGRVVLARPSGDVSERLPLFTPAVTGAAAPYGFGLVRVCGAAPECAQALNAMVGEAREGPVKPVGPASRWERGNLLVDGLTPLLAGARAPVGRFLLLIFAFVLAVGPGSLMLARRQGPVAVLVAVPLVSVVTCMALIAWSVLVDGFSVHSARYSLTWLDSGRSRAVTLGVAAWYANVSSGPVRFPVMSALVAQQASDEALVDLDWTNGLTVVDGFLPPRTYREWGEVAVLPSRARLLVRREGGTVRVQNALGARLESGYIRVGDQLHALPVLDDGAEGALGEVLPEGWMPVSEVLSREGGSLAQGRLSGREEHFRAPLPEGGFIARLGGVGMAPSSTVDMELEAGIHVVRGQTEEVRP